MQKFHSAVLSVGAGQFVAEDDQLAALPEPGCDVSACVCDRLGRCREREAGRESPLELCADESVETCTFGIGLHVHAKHQRTRDGQDPCAYT